MKKALLTLLLASPLIAAAGELEQSRLHAFTAPRAREVGRIRNNPQQMQAYCTKQNATARRLLMKY